MAFKKGQSGNPKGRPKKSQNKTTEYKKLLAPHADELIAKLIGLALDGDVSAMRLCIDRITPPIKARDSTVNIKGFTGSPVEKSNAITKAVANGEITPQEAQALISVVLSHTKIVESTSLEERLTALEQKADELPR